MTDNLQVPFAQCDLWEKQKVFYQSKKIQAWDKLLPFYATSNPYIAHSYAQVIIRFIQDLQRLDKYSSAEPLYILELGAGPGVFSYYLLKALTDLQAGLKLEAVKINYIMADITDNSDFWQSQPRLQPYVENSMLDFAIFDIDNLEAIYLLKAAKTLTRADLQNPLIVIANYCFDSLRHDFFRVKEQKLQVGLINPNFEINSQLNNVSVALTSLDPAFQFVDIVTPYYQHKAIDAVLDYYLTNFTNLTITLPIGALVGIDKLRQLTHDNLLLLITDKGFAHLGKDLANYEPELAMHGGAVSIMTNFHALNEYSRQLGGDSYCQSLDQIIITSALLAGHNLIDLTETRQAIVSYIEKQGPGNWLNFHNHIIKTAMYSGLEILISYLANSFWDPQIFNICFAYMVNESKAASSTLLQNLVNGLEQVAANYYFLPGADNTLFNIGLLLQEAGFYQPALKYYQQSLNYFKEDPATFYNMGLCCYFLQEYQAALDNLQQVLALNQDHLLAEGWLNYIYRWYYQPLT